MSIEVVSQKAPEPVVEKPAEEAKETAVEEQKAESAAEETPAESTEESEASETETEEKEESEEEQTEEGDRPKKKSGFKKRIDKLNKRVADKEREAEYWRELAMKGTQKEQKPETPEAKSDGEPSEDDYESHAEYVKALARWEYKQAKKEDEEKQRKQSVETEHSRMVSDFMKKAEEFKSENPDYDDVIAEIDESGFKMSPVLESVLLRKGPELTYALAKQRDELERIAALPPLDLAYEIGRFEARLAAKAQKQESKTTKAPAPINPLGGKGAVAPKKTIWNAASQREYEEARAQMKSS